MGLTDTLLPNFSDANKTKTTRNRVLHKYVLNAFLLSKCNRIHEKNFIFYKIFRNLNKKERFK